MLGIARGALSAMVPVELLLVILLASGVSLPGWVIVVAELAAASVFVLETVTVYRLFRAERRGGADRRTALRAAVDRLVPERVRRIMDFDLKGMVSLVLWITRRRDGVPPGATAASYSRAQTSTMTMFLFMMIVELVGVEILLRAFGAPAGLRTLILVVDAYGILFALAVIAACVTRPHVVSPGELRIRYGAFFDLRVPRDLISSVRLSRNYNESGMITLTDGRLGVAVSSQTNVVVELTEPVTVVRPLGSRAEATAIRFFTDDPDATLQALRHREDPRASSPV
ncbi:hypothetical protein [Streptosporangium sp. NPDC000396]|uniref:hypothetical protein n=1 Tax=Streptosporangium sp. NPDC000396 TaxID=3366185 RepID=UPI00367718BE